MDSTRAYYEDQAEEYRRRTFGVNLGSLRAALAARLAVGTRVLDAGCGPGRDVAAFAALGFEAFGVDLARAPLESAAPVLDRTGRLVQGDLRRLPFADGAFGGLWLCASLVHLPRAEVPAALGEAARVLTPGGCLLASFKAGSGEGPAADGRWFTYHDEPEVQRLAAAAGLEPLALWLDRTASDTWIELLARRPG